MRGLAKSSLAIPSKTRLFTKKHKVQEAINSNKGPRIEQCCLRCRKNVLSFHTSSIELQYFPFPSQPNKSDTGINHKSTSEINLNFN